MRIVKFIPRLLKEAAFTYPAKASVPEWWRRGEKTVDVNGETLAGMKACIPFMEVMGLGYVIKTPFDIYVGEDEDGNIHIRWNAPDTFSDYIGERPANLGATIPRPAGHHPNGFIWACAWGWKTPKGYGSLVVHPFNQYDLPFTTLNGFIDSDGFNANGNIPFFVKAGFTGVIPEGTPFAQIIPVKREKWKMWVDDSGLDSIEKQGREIRLPDTSYKKKYWKMFMRDFS